MLVCDLTSTSLGLFAGLAATRVTFILRAQHNLSYDVARKPRCTAHMHECRVSIDNEAECWVVQWISVSRYSPCWRIEDAFALVKRLFDLSYLRIGSADRVQVQLWLPASSTPCYST